jgi:hypothetical protein
MKRSKTSVLSWPNPTGGIAGQGSALGTCVVLQHSHQALRTRSMIAVATTAATEIFGRIVGS